MVCVLCIISLSKADIFLQHGDKVSFGSHELEVRSTPGHTNGCVTYICHKEKLAFTGDALLIRGCGRTDFQVKELSKQTVKNSHKTKWSIFRRVILLCSMTQSGTTYLIWVTNSKSILPTIIKVKQFLQLLKRRLLILDLQSLEKSSSTSWTILTWPTQKRLTSLYQQTEFAAYMTFLIVWSPWWSNTKTNFFLYDRTQSESSFEFFYQKIIMLIYILKSILSLFSNIVIFHCRKY